VIAVLATVGCLGAASVAGIRWLRVAQREHYAPGRVSRFQRRWEPPWAVLTSLVGLVGLVIGEPALVLVTAIFVGIGPPGLSIKGRTSPLAWTRRLKTTAAVAAALAATVLGAATIAASPWQGAFVLCIGTAQLIDLALAIAAPFERRAARSHVEAATSKLRQVNPIVVAITGSYGKTTTKGYLRHLLEGVRSVVASPASFNNTAGLSRAINEGLHSGTEVFIAEMGAYGPGEIADLCRWIQPDVAAICAIGPVHLERYGSIERIVAAKSEILGSASTVVLNIDAAGLAETAARAAQRGQRVVRVSAHDPEADATVTRTSDGLAVEVYGSLVATIESTGRHPSNVATAVGLALALDVEVAHIVDRLGDLPAAEHRQQVVTAPSGVVLIDDTFNANPAGAAAALDLLADHQTEGRRVVVTPGMIELGRRQDDENRAFALRAASEATDIAVVGRTNRAALLAGAGNGDAAVHTFPTREAAVEWVRANLTAGDVVLYENDLPDHYP